PDIVIVIDPTLLSSVNVKEGLKKDGFMLVNTKTGPGEVSKITGYAGKIYVCDATGIALQYIGSPVPNMPMLGALLKIEEVVKKESLIEEFKKKLGKKLKPEKMAGNIKAVEEAYNGVK
ncbi:MAG TPA: 2-oxoacid:acceptor oxidoreductase family protein, partial [bacterium]|nr:2-oxoacid:acceptor oxidoreductase family protein [bacterium]